MLFRSNKLGQWSYFGAPIGDFGTEYAYRALVAIAGLGANTVAPGVDEATCNVLMDLMLEMYMQGQTLLAVLHDSERVSRHFPQTLRLDTAIPHWKTERVRVA